MVWFDLVRTLWFGLVNFSMFLFDSSMVWFDQLLSGSVKAGSMVWFAQLLSGSVKTGSMVWFGQDTVASSLQASSPLVYRTVTADKISYRLFLSRNV